MQTIKCTAEQFAKLFTFTLWYNMRPDWVVEQLSDRSIDEIESVRWEHLPQQARDLFDIECAFINFEIRAGMLFIDQHFDGERIESYLLVVE